jgi:succinoglycan biosynthesis transport protein ExoP
MSDNQPELISKNKDQLHFRSELGATEILMAVFRRKLSVFIIMTICVIGSAVYHFTLPPEYHAQAVILIAHESQGAADLVDALYGNGIMADNKAAAKDVELLQSLPIAQLVVKELWASSQRPTLEFFGNRTYISLVDRILIRLGLMRNPVNTSEYFKDVELSDESVRRYALLLCNRIKVQPSRETSILKVSVGSPFADEAVFLTNTLYTVYKNSDIKRKSEKYIQGNRFVSEILGEQQALVAEADKALSQYMISNKIYEASGNSSPLLQKMVELDSRYNEIMVESRIVQNSRKFLEQKLSEADKSLSLRISENVNAQLGSIQDEIRARESEYIGILRKKNSKNTDVQAKKQALDAVKARYEQLSRSKISGQIGYAGRSQKYSFDLISEKLQIERKLDQLNFSANEFIRLRKYYESQLNTLPEKQQRYLKLQRDKEVVSKTYLFLKEKVDQTRILIGSEVGSVSVVGSAFKPFIPQSPDIKKNLVLGLMIGLSFGILYVSAAEYFDDTVKDINYLKNLGFNIFGVIPFIPKFGKGQKQKNTHKGIGKFFYGIYYKLKLTMNGSSKNPELDGFTYPLMTDKLNSTFSECFRSLRTNLNYSNIDKPLRTILISGASAHEGKSTVCANLGISLAISGKRTLIIDCDLRRPSQHKIFNVKRVKGLTEYLVNQQQVVEDQYFQKTHLPNLFLFSAGSSVPNPNELLGSLKMQRLLKILEDRFDNIVLDSPPVFLSDAAQIAAYVDTILIVTRLYHSYKYPLKEYATDAILRPHILGIVLIDSHGAGKYGYQKFGYQKYGYQKYGYHSYSSYSSSPYENDV